MSSDRKSRIQSDALCAKCPIPGGRGAGRPRGTPVDRDAGNAGGGRGEMAGRLVAELINFQKGNEA